MNDDRNIFFSIIIPTYNRAHLIGKTIDSVLKQTYKHFEIIVVDDGSTDDTELALQQYASDNFIYIKKQNEERAAARNFGSKLAKGDYVNWFDSDDIMLPDNLAEALKMIHNFQQPEIFALGYRAEDSAGNVIRRNHYPQPIFNSLLYKGNPLNCNPVFVRRDIALQNPFNEDRQLTVSEDFELWLRLAARYSIYCSNAVTSLLIFHDQRSMLTMNVSEKLVPRYEKLIQLVLANPEVVKFLGNKKGIFVAKRYLQLSCVLAIAGYKKEVIKYIFKAIRYSGMAVFEKAFFVALRYLFFVKANPATNNL